jgi:hypothetical protein
MTANENEPPKYRDLAYLLAMNFKTLTLLLLAFVVGDWLDQRYVMPVSGYALSFFCAGLVIVYTWYIFFKRLLSKQ